MSPPDLAYAIKISLPIACHDYLIHRSKRDIGQRKLGGGRVEDWTTGPGARGLMNGELIDLPGPIGCERHRFGSFFRHQAYLECFLGFFGMLKVRVFGWSGYDGSYENSVCG